MKECIPTFFRKIIYWRPILVATKSQALPLATIRHLFCLPPNHRTSHSLQPRITSRVSLLRNHRLHPHHVHLFLFRQVLHLRSYQAQNRRYLFTPAHRIAQAPARPFLLSPAAVQLPLLVLCIVQPRRLPRRQV